MVDALRLDGVTKRFGEFTAVNGLSFAVPEGEVFGFLGGNGGGKTTSLRMVLDIIGRVRDGSRCSAARPGGRTAPTSASCPRSAGCIGA